MSKTYSSYHNKYLYSHIEKGSLLDEIGTRDLLIQYKHNNKLCTILLCFTLIVIINKLFNKQDFIKDFREFFDNGKLNK